MKAHFDKVVSRYGHVTVISLVEKTGKEAILGDVFTKVIDLLDDKTNIRLVSAPFIPVVFLFPTRPPPPDM